MLTVISDTHGRDTPRFDEQTRAAVREADHVVHAGDFTTEAVLDAIEAEATALTAVYGNNDSPAVRDRLTDVATLNWEGVRIVVVHGHEHSATALSMLARQEAADVVVVGHSHRPVVEELEAGCVLLNPGSYADPRRYQPAYAQLDRSDGTVRVCLESTDGTSVSTVTLEVEQ